MTFSEEQRRKRALFHGIERAVPGLTGVPRFDDRRGGLPARTNSAQP